MPYEEINGEVVTMADNNDIGFSGESTDFPGEHQTYIKVYWNSISGITRWGNWAGFNNNEEITTILNDTSLSDAEKKTNINEAIYPQVTALLNSEEENAWGSFYNTYEGCVTVG